MNSSNPNTSESSFNIRSPYDPKPAPQTFPTCGDLEFFSFHTTPSLDLNLGTLALGSSHRPSPHSNPPTTNNPYPTTSPTAPTFSSIPAQTFNSASPTVQSLVPPPMSSFHPSRGLDPNNLPTTSGLTDDSLRNFTTSPLSSTNSSSSTRYNPIAGTRFGRVGLARAAHKGDDLSDEEGDEVVERPVPMPMPHPGSMQSPEEVRQQCRQEMRQERIENERRRRDELRDGYNKLRFALPISTQKNSKANLLNRAVSHIRHIEEDNRSLRTLLKMREQELTELRNTNEMRNIAHENRVAANVQNTAAFS